MHTRGDAVTKHHGESAGQVKTPRRHGVDASTGARAHQPPASSCGPLPNVPYLDCVVPILGLGLRLGESHSADGGMREHHSGHRFIVRLHHTHHAQTVKADRPHHIASTPHDAHKQGNPILPSPHTPSCRRVIIHHNAHPNTNNYIYTNFKIISNS